MRIVNRDTFIALPSGTVFSKYEPCCFGAVKIKGASMVFDGGGNDFADQAINDAIECDSSEDFMAKLEDSRQTGKSLAMDFDFQGRDGCYEDDQLFAAWEKKDVVALIERLKETL